MKAKLDRVVREIQAALGHSSGGGEWTVGESCKIVWPGGSGGCLARANPRDCHEATIGSDAPVQREQAESVLLPIELPSAIGIRVEVGAEGSLSGADERSEAGVDVVRAFVTERRQVARRGQAEVHLLTGPRIEDPRRTIGSLQRSRRDAQADAHAV